VVVAPVCGDTRDAFRSVPGPVRSRSNTHINRTTRRSSRPDGREGAGDRTVPVVRSFCLTSGIGRDGAILCGAGRWRGSGRMGGDGASPVAAGREPARRRLEGSCTGHRELCRGWGVTMSSRSP
jgi:hypothetical protein